MTQTLSNTQKKVAVPARAQDCGMEEAHDLGLIPTVNQDLPNKSAGSDACPQKARTDICNSTAKLTM